MKFIYAMSVDDKNKLEALGYKLIKSDRLRNVYVFANKYSDLFSADDELTSLGIKFVQSDMLTF